LCLCTGHATALYTQRAHSWLAPDGGWRCVRCKTGADRLAGARWSVACAASTIPLACEQGCIHVSPHLAGELPCTRLIPPKVELTIAFAPSPPIAWPLRVSLFGGGVDFLVVHNSHPTQLVLLELAVLDDAHTFGSPLVIAACIRPRLIAPATNVPCTHRTVMAGVAARVGHLPWQFRIVRGRVVDVTLVRGGFPIETFMGIRAAVWMAIRSSACARVRFHQVMFGHTAHIHPWPTDGCSVPAQLPDTPTQVRPQPPMTVRTRPLTCAYCRVTFSTEAEYRTRCAPDAVAA
jgi:hypothetical protein